MILAGAWVAQSMISLLWNLLHEARDWVCGLPDPFLVARRLREGCATGSLLLRVACSKKNNRPFIYNHTLRIPGGCPTSTKEPSRREKWWTSQLFSHTFAFLEAGSHKMDITFEHPSCCAIIFSFKFVKLSNILFKKGCAIPWIFYKVARSHFFQLLEMLAQYLPPVTIWLSGDHSKPVVSFGAVWTFSTFFYRK